MIPAAPMWSTPPADEAAATRTHPEEGEPTTLPIARIAHDTRPRLWDTPASTPAVANLRAAIEGMPQGERMQLALMLPLTPSGVRVAVYLAALATDGGGWACSPRRASIRHGAGVGGTLNRALAAARPAVELRHVRRGNKVRTMYVFKGAILEETVYKALAIEDRSRAEPDPDPCYLLPPKIRALARAVVEWEARNAPATPSGKRETRSPDSEWEARNAPAAALREARFAPQGGGWGERDMLPTPDEVGISLSPPPTASANRASHDSTVEQQAVIQQTLADLQRYPQIAARFAGGISAAASYFAKYPELLAAQIAQEERAAKADSRVYGQPNPHAVALWETAKGRVQHTIDQVTYEGYIEPSEGHSFDRDRGVMIVACRSEGAIRWLEDNKQTFERLVNEGRAEHYTLRFALAGGDDDWRTRDKVRVDEVFREPRGPLVRRPQRKLF